MRVPRLYLALPLAESTTVSLTKEQTHYLATVLRLREGAAVVAFNGDGVEYGAVLTSVERKGGVLQVQARRSTHCESPLKLRLALGISRGERMTYAIQKAVELGVTHIQPLITEFCEVRADKDRAEKRQHHWLGIVHSACEQSGRTRIPEVAPVQALETWLSSITQMPNTQPDLRVALDPHGSAGFHALPAQASQVTLLVGPEGGLGELDLKSADRAGFIRVRLGPRVLRTETAAAAALVAAQFQWGDLR